MTASRISDEKPDLSPVLGELDEEQAGRLQTELSAADEALTGVVTTLDQRGGDGFHSEGVILEREVSGQALIRVLLEDAKGAVGFGAELRPKNFYANDGNPWQPGRPPMVMDTSGWDVGGEVTVRYKTRVGARPYTIQEQVLELEEERYDSADEAVAAFAARCEQLADLALSRDPTVAAWKPEIPESVGGQRLS